MEAKSYSEMATVKIVQGSLRSVAQQMSLTFACGGAVPVTAGEGAPGSGSPPSCLPRPGVGQGLAGVLPAICAPLSKGSHLLGFPFFWGE